MRLRDLRDARDLSLRDLAERSGISWVTIHAIEQERSVPQPRSVRAIARALGVEPDHVIEFVTARRLRRERMVRPTSYRPVSK